MTPFVSYLFARAGGAAGAPLVELRPDAMPPADLTVVLAHNGLFVRVATTALQALLPLASFREGTVRGLAPCEPALLHPLGDVPAPSVARRPALAYAVARGTGRLLPINLSYGHAAAPGWPLTYIVAGNGLFASHVTPLYEALVQVCTLPASIGSHLGLDALDEGVTLRVPRIPACLLHACALDAARITQQAGHEALWDFHWSESAGWSLVSPAQEASAAHVSAAPLSDPGVLLTLHSHGRHRTYWSATDDRDEQRCGLNAVIGDLGDGLRSARLRVRVSVFGHRRDIPAAALFEGLLPIAEAQRQPEEPAACPGQRATERLPGGTAAVDSALERLVDEALELERALDRALECAAPSAVVQDIGGRLGRAWERLGEADAAAAVRARVAMAAQPLAGPYDSAYSGAVSPAEGNRGDRLATDTPGQTAERAVPARRTAPHLASQHDRHSERRQRGGLAGFLGRLRRDRR